MSTTPTTTPTPTPTASTTTTTRSSISTTVDIAAPPSVVWGVLTDGASYPDWNPFVRRLEGRLELGARLRVRIEPPGKRGMNFRPTVVALEPERAFAWLGRLGVRGLLDGRHSFTLEPLDGGTATRLVHAESFRGVLVPLVGRTMAAAAEGFEAFNAALRERAERLADAAR